MILAARRDPELMVPHYEGWTLADLCSHVGSIHGRTTQIATELPQEKISAPRLPEGADAVDWCESQLEEMLTALRDADSEAECWAFGSETTLGSWEVRMVCETGVHRWDAYDAHGEADRLLDVVAEQGLDEFQRWYVPMINAKGGLILRATDMDRVWDYGDEPFAEIEGTASDIYLRLMQRTSPIVLPEEWAAAVDAFGKPPKR